MADLSTDNRKYYRPTKAFRWYERVDAELWINEGRHQRVRTLQQYWENTVTPGPQGEWRDVPTEVEGDG